VHSSSDPNEIDPRAEWLQARAQDALTRFADRTPVIYRRPITLDADTNKAVTDWIGGWTGNSLFLTGSIGVGKTHTAWEICRRWLVAAYGPARPWQGSPLVRTFRSTALFDALRPDAPDDERLTLSRELQRCDLLYIDDLAAAKVTEWTQERLFEIFDERYINRLPVIVTSDVLPGDLIPVTGPRVASRLGEMCRGSVLLLEGHDRRRGEAA
jgi:DNA replication protein DnaC